MTFEWVVLISVLVVVIVGGSLIWRAQTRGSDISAGMSVAELFSVELQISSAVKEEAQKAVQAADKSHGVSSTDRVELIEGRSTVLARVLWVDDEPANNIFESLALEKLGKLVSSVTDSMAVHRLVENIEYDLLITDMMRGGNPEAGVQMIRTLRERGFDKPIIVYTGNAAGWERDAREAGADAVADRAGDLVRAVVEYSSASRSRQPQ